MAQDGPMLAKDGPRWPKEGRNNPKTWNILTILSSIARGIFIYLKNPEFELKLPCL